MVETPLKPAERGIIPPFDGNHLLPDFEKPHPLRRLLVGAACVAAGTVAIAIGLSSISYRLTHVTVDGGLINGRVVRLRAPIDGKIKAFYASQGAPVKSGQVLARIERTSQANQNLLQLQGAVQVKAFELEGAKQSLSFLQQQLQSLNSQDQALQTFNTGLSAKEVTHQEAAVDAAIAKAKSAQLDYERYQQLLAEGAISRQKVEQQEFIWKSAEAEVKQAKADLAVAEAELQALEDGVALNPGATLADQRVNILQTIQSQTARISKLTSELESNRKRLKEAEQQYSDRQDLEVKAPFSGVIYNTERDQDEQVNRPDVLLTLLDCNDLWVETLVTADQANRIDSQKPVRVQLAGETDTFVGEVHLIEAVTSAELAKDQAQALIPAVSSHLLGQPLAKVTVRIPPTVEQSEANQFCGVGQSASLTFGTTLFKTASR